MSVIRYEFTAQGTFADFYILRQIFPQINCKMMKSIQSYITFPLIILSTNATCDLKKT